MKYNLKKIKTKKFLLIESTFALHLSLITMISLLLKPPSASLCPSIHIFVSPTMSLIALLSTSLTCKLQFPSLMSI